MKNRKKKIIALRGFLILVALIVLAGGINHKAILRVYRGVRMFEPARMNESFRNLDNYFLTNKVEPSDKTHSFTYDLKKLPKTYHYMGQERSIEGFIERTGTTGLIVVKDGQILFEEYYNGYKDTDRMILWSVSKSFISALVGIAIQDGFIGSVHDYVSEYVPSLKESGYKEVTIKDVLQMSSGIRFDEDYSNRRSDVNQMGSRAMGFGGTLEGLLLTLERDKDPGTYNRYISSDTQVLGMVLIEATGVGIAEYTQEKIWRPAGMEFEAHWLIDSSGIESAFGGLNASLRDLARFGMIYLNGGRLMDNQIIPEQWIIDSIKVNEDHLIPGVNPNSSSVLGYGYQWWIPSKIQNDFLAMGIYGQSIYINIDAKVVIVKTSAYKDYLVDGEEMEHESIEFFRMIARDLN